MAKTNVKWAGDDDIRSVHILPNEPREASGHTASIYGLCHALLKAGYKTKLAAFGPLQSEFNKEFVEAFHRNFALQHFGVSRQMKQWLYAQTLSGHCNIVHAHGLWRMANIYPVKAVQNTQVKYVVSPHGSLSPSALKYSALAKKVFWLMFQKKALSNAAGFHATSESEYKDIRNLGFRQPVAVIPNGISLPKVSEKKIKPLKQLLFLGRIHPIKGIDNLLKAWREVQDCHQDWQLIIAGPDIDGYLAKIQMLAKELQLTRCEFLGGVYGQKKMEAYHQADLYVLPSHSENFGMTVGEALASETPVITTKGTPWEGLHENRAGWWIDFGVDPLVDALEQAFTLPDGDLEKYGRNGRDWMIRDFSWDSFGNKMASYYHWLINGGDVPSFVRID